MSVRISRAVLAIANDVATAQFHGLDLRVGNSTNLSTAQFCDTVDANLLDNGGIVTLWCLLPTFGRYVFIYRSLVAYTPSPIPISEVLIY
jgi:hypothetical protein